MVGADGIQLLAYIDDPHAPQGLKELSEVEILPHIWEHHYEQIDREVRVPRPKRCLKLPAASNLPTRWEWLATLPNARWIGSATRCIHGELRRGASPSDHKRPHETTASDVKQLRSSSRGLRRMGCYPPSNWRTLLRLWQQPRFEPRFAIRSTSSAHLTKTIRRPKPMKASTWGRLADWLNGVPAAATRRSRLAALAQAS